MARTFGELAGALFGLALAIGSALYFLGVRDLYLFSPFNMFVFAIGGLLYAIFVAVLGAMLGGFVAGLLFGGRRQPVAAVVNEVKEADADIIEAEVISDESPPSRGIQFGNHVAKWGWIFGLFGIFLCLISAMVLHDKRGVINSATVAPFVASICAVAVGGICLVIGGVTMFRRFHPKLLVHFAAGAFANAAGFFGVLICTALFVGAHAAQERQEQLAAQGPNMRMDRGSPRGNYTPRTWRPDPRRQTKPKTIQDAVAQNRVDDVERFIKEGADINEIYRDGQTLLIRATTRGHYHTAALLLKHGANVNDNPEKETFPAHISGPATPARPGSSDPQV